MSNFEPREGDIPRDDLILHAQEAIDRYERNCPGHRCIVWFKTTCEKCGERIPFEEPNTMFASIECFKCRHEMPFVSGGYILALVPKEQAEEYIRQFRKENGDGK